MSLSAVFWAALVLAAVALTPFFAYTVSKWSQVGRLSGTRWFIKRCKGEE